MSSPSGKGGRRTWISWLIAGLWIDHLDEVIGYLWVGVFTGSELDIQDLVIKKQGIWRNLTVREDHKVKRMIWGVDIWGRMKKQITGCNKLQNQSPPLERKEMHSIYWSHRLSEFFSQNSLLMGFTFMGLETLYLQNSIFGQKQPEIIWVQVFWRQTISLEQQGHGNSRDFWPLLVFHLHLEAGKGSDDLNKCSAAYGGHSCLQHYFLEYFSYY